MPAATLPGPSRTIVVEPIQAPEREPAPPAREPEPAESPPPRREPEPAPA